jgi:hypothetical protein
LKAEVVGIAMPTYLPVQNFDIGFLVTGIK